MEEYLKYIKIINGEYEVESWLKEYLKWDLIEKFIMFYLYEDKTLNNFITCCVNNLNKNIYHIILNNWVLNLKYHVLEPKCNKEKILFTHNKTMINILQSIVLLDDEIKASITLTKLSVP